MSLEQIKELNDTYFANTGHRRRVYLRTYGCQMNVHDSEKIKGMLEHAGYAPAETEKEADLIVYNTCCVRENAENKVYGHLGILKVLKQEKPDLKIVLCGCMMQQEQVVERLMQAHRHVDVIFGTYNLHKLGELLFTHLQTQKPVIDVWQKQDEKSLDDLPTVRDFPHKAGVNIMYGCNNFCAYCIVPYVRGRERSRTPEDIVAEIEALVQDGVKEVLLLGQNVNSYGLGLEEKIDFPGLLRKVAAIKGLERIRFMTSHPKDLSDDLIDVMAQNHNVCNHLHLPVQSGSNAMLTAMNRKYTREHYLALLEKVRAKVPNMAITTDIIVGFPGESEEDFLDTLHLTQEARYAGAFTFIYSIRTGTPAATMGNQVPEEVAGKRLTQLLDAINPIQLAFNQSKIGQTLSVLFDSFDSAKGVATGRTMDNSLVHVPGDDSFVGQIKDVTITGCKTFYLSGEINM